MIGNTFTINSRIWTLLSESGGTSKYKLDGSSSLTPTLLTIKHTVPDANKRYDPNNAPIVRRLISVTVPELDLDSNPTGRSVTCNFTVTCPVNITGVASSDAFDMLVEVLANAAVTLGGTAAKFMNGEN